MSQAYSGVEANVICGATDVDAQGWSLDIEANTFDSTTTADLGWDDTTGSTKKVSGSFDFFYNKLKKPFGPLNLIPGASFSGIFYINKTDDEKMTGNGLITKVSFKNKIKDGALLTASFVNKGPWVLPS